MLLQGIENSFVLFSLWRIMIKDLNGDPTLVQRFFDVNGPGAKVMIGLQINERNVFRRAAHVFLQTIPLQTLNEKVCQDASKSWILGDQVQIFLLIDLKDGCFTD